MMNPGVLIAVYQAVEFDSGDTPMKYQNRIPEIAGTSRVSGDTWRASEFSGNLRVM
jgi:hypothetical protein